VCSFLLYFEEVSHLRKMLKVGIGMTYDMHPVFMADCSGHITCFYLRSIYL
jgi:hypothetical protein